MFLRKVLIWHYGDIRFIGIEKSASFAPSKQTIRRIQIFDPHGMPLHPSQEFQLIEQDYTALYPDDKLALWD